MKMKDRKLLPQNRGPKGKFEEFLEGFKEYEKEYLLEDTQDEFLDAYSRWLKTKLLKDKLTAIRIGMKLEALDAEFSLKQIFPLK